VADVRLRIQTLRFDLGLHGLALLRAWPFGDADAAERRMDAMRRLLNGEGEPETYETREVDALEVDAAYEDWAPRYDGSNPLIATEEATMLDVLAGLPTGMAVDVAAGTGRLAGHLARLGHTVVAIDRGEAMLRRAAEHGATARLCRGDLLRLPLRSSTADLLTCALALTHVTDLDAAFQEFARVVRPGGAVVTSDIHPFAVATGAHAFFERPDGSRAVVRNELHWPSAYVKAATAPGLVVERCDEALVDEALLQNFGIHDAFLSPENAGMDLPETAILGLPFVLLWVFRRPEVTPDGLGPDQRV
jgi:ubiquinone/menaquinone biosynthesis C-methylase UbiE